MNAHTVCTAIVRVYVNVYFTQMLFIHCQTNMSFSISTSLIMLIITPPVCLRDGAIS